MKLSLPQTQTTGSPRPNHRYLHRWTQDIYKNHHLANYYNHWLLGQSQSPQFFPNSPAWLSTSALTRHLPTKAWLGGRGIHEPTNLWNRWAKIKQKQIRR